MVATQTLTKIAIAIGPLSLGGAILIKKKLESKF